MLENGGPPVEPPARSLCLYKHMIASLGEEYPGARLEVVDWGKIPSKPRTYG